MGKKLKFPKDRPPGRIRNTKNMVICGGLRWKVHLPNLLKEISTSLRGASALKIPLLTLANILMLVSKRALELNDPELNALMMDLSLYEVEDKTDESD